MAKVTLSLIWILILIYIIGHCTCTDFDCNSECFSAHSDSPEDEITCDLLLAALSCYDNNSEACDNDEQAFTISFRLNQVRNGIREKNCSTPTATPATPALAPVTCPIVPLQVTYQTLESPDMDPEGTIPSQCLVQDTDIVSHCSIFMHSHLRPFHYLAGSRSIQTCSLPGAWLLLGHDGLIVEVEGTAESPSSMDTQLTKVKVTFPSSGNCNGVNRTYSAYGDQQLSQLFDCETTSHNNSNSPLQLHLSEGGTVVTLLATWLDSIIVIRKMERFLAVTIKVTGHIAFESEGLCNAGCPNHQYVDSKSYIEGDYLNQNCQTVRTPALLDCFGVITRPGLDSSLLFFNNVSYADSCVYSMLKAENEHVKVMMEAVTRDATLLVDRGTVPRPEPRNHNNQLVLPSNCNLPTTTHSISTITTPTSNTANIANSTLDNSLFISSGMTTSSFQILLIACQLYWYICI